MNATNSEPLNQTEIALLREYHATSPAPDAQCIRIGNESISPRQALIKAEAGTADARIVFTEMEIHIRNNLKTALI